MTAILIILAAAIIITGYILYGGWLAEIWGIRSRRKILASEKDRGFSPLITACLFVGCVSAAKFGWAAVILWCILGGVFFGRLHNIGFLLLSSEYTKEADVKIYFRNIIEEIIGKRAGRLFSEFALLTAGFLAASLVHIATDTFESGYFGLTTTPSVGETAAMSAVLFLILTVIYTIARKKLEVKRIMGTIAAGICVPLILILGIKVGFAMPRIAWTLFIFLYIIAASSLPYFSKSFNYLTGWLCAIAAGIIFIGVFISLFVGVSRFQIPAFITTDTFFPTLFLMIPTCFALSALFSLKQDRIHQKKLSFFTFPLHSMPVAFGFGLLALLSVGMSFNKHTLDSPISFVFASGISNVFQYTSISHVPHVVQAFLLLTASMLILSSLSAAVNIARSVYFINEKKVAFMHSKVFQLAPTFIISFVVSLLSILESEILWLFFTAANSLFSVIVFLTVITWLDKVQKNNKLLIFPTVFMLCAALVELVLIIKDQASIIIFGTGHKIINWCQLCFSLVISVFAILLTLESIGIFINLWKSHRLHENQK